MVHPGLKRAVFSSVLSIVWLMGSRLSPAQVFPWEAMTAPLVNITAVDAPALHMQDGRIGIGSQERFGQGIILDGNGVIVANRHVISHAQHVYVDLKNGKRVEANILHNGHSDVCLLKINVPFRLPAAVLAPYTQIQPGKNIIAIGNSTLNHPKELDGKVVRVFNQDTTQKPELLEMDIPLKAGDSGGAILNEEGSLVGLVLAQAISDPGKALPLPLNGSARNTPTTNIISSNPVLTPASSPLPRICFQEDR